MEGSLCLPCLRSPWEPCDLDTGPCSDIPALPIFIHPLQPSVRLLPVHTSLHSVGEFGRRSPHNTRLKTLGILTTVLNWNALCSGLTLTSCHEAWNNMNQQTLSCKECRSDSCVLCRSSDALFICPGCEIPGVWTCRTYQSALGWRAVSHSWEQLWSYFRWITPRLSRGFSSCCLRGAPLCEELEQTTSLQPVDTLTLVLLLPNSPKVLCPVLIL